uniref:TonB-dependent receptor n=1 Tax=uncultured Caulobacter sp. TaxID=158749 RepID=UPI0025D248AD|nr:TonB-dependent receptor [uncultured Caulobacter sp.]
MLDQLMTRVSCAALIAAGGLAIATPVLAQTTPPAADQAETVTEVVVTGYRASVASALETKRRANDMQDTIKAEDIGKFPDANLAESLQRLPGVSIDRDNGEGRRISIRGLGPDFSRVRLNGLEALSTSGGNDSGSTPNRSRGFDFNAFASELFSQLTVRKTASAEVDEGSLGATVDLSTGRPLDYKGRKLSLSVQDGYYENGKRHNPRLAGLIADQWDTGIGRFGLAVSGVYNKARRSSDGYSRGPASYDYAYSRPFATPTLTAGSPAAGIPEREGFAAPSTVVCDGGTATAPNLNGVIPGVNITRLDACNAQRGSDPGAYALIYPNGGAIRQLVNGVATQTTAGSTVIVPTLPTLNHQEIETERTGFTASAQWKPTNRTLISVDGVYSRLKQSSNYYQISTIGLNRFGNTVTGYNTATTGSAALYSSCSTTGLVRPIACEGTSGNGAVLPGFANSTNPYNLNAYDYYNNPQSKGYIPTTNGLALFDALIGKPTTRIMDAHVDTSNPKTPVADYMKLGNIDYRSANDANRYATTFKQLSVTLDQDLTDDLKLSVVGGYSESANSSLGLLSDLSRLDSGQGTPGNDYFVYDARGGGSMPILNFGFDAANPNNWDTIKGLSVLRVQARETKNTFKNLRADFNWRAFGEDHIKWGASFREFGFDTSELRRASNEAVSPTLLEAGSTVAATGRVIEWGQGLKVPAGTTTRFWAPDNKKMAAVFGFDCDCVNKYGDFRLSYGGSPGLNYQITEKDTGGYVQYDYSRSLLGIDVRGNVGVRYANTKVTANGLTPTLANITNTNEYNDWLPSLNAVFELTPNMLVRFGAAKVMSRPSLAQLAPGITTFTVPTTAGAITGGAVTSGNTKLSPFRANNLDLSYEWYFARSALISVAVFNKDVKSFPQTVLAQGKLGDYLDPGIVAQLRAGVTASTAAGDAQRAYIDGNNDFAFSLPLDAPGGYIRGVEINYQQNFTFLPGFLKNFGAQVNYTHIESELKYIIDTGSVAAPVRPQQIGKAPFLGASPDSVNATLYYETPKWTARVSAAYRSKYYSTYPLQSGSCQPGMCLTPLINDFAGSRSTTNIDGSFSYELFKGASLVIEALNLTNQTSNRFAFDGNPVVTQYASTGRQFNFGVRMTF